MTDSLERIRGLAWLLDNSIPIPGARMRVGLDPVLGLIPGLGDATGAIFSSYIVIEAARLGASRSTLLRMAWNVVLETLVGVIPLLGDLFDAGWKANQKNIALLERYLEAPGTSVTRDRAFLAALFVMTAALLAGIVGGGFLLVRRLFGL